MKLLGTVRAPAGSLCADAYHVAGCEQPTIARSVHLAMSGGDGTMAALNDDYGVMFARGDYTGVDRVALRGVSNPSLFHFSDGAIGVIATRVDMDGKQDPPRSAVVIFRGDPKSAQFVEVGTLDLGSNDGIDHPRAMWDSAAQHYIVSWIDRSGQPRWTTVADLARQEWQPTAYYPETGGRRARIASKGNGGDVRIGDLATTASDTLPVDDITAAALNNRFGRIVNTTATVTPQTIRRGRADNLAIVPVKLGYSDGSTATRSVDWDAGDLAQLTRPGGIASMAPSASAAIRRSSPMNAPIPISIGGSMRAGSTICSWPPTIRTTTMSARPICAPRRRQDRGPCRRQWRPRTGGGPAQSAHPPRSDDGRPNDRGMLLGT